MTSLAHRAEYGALRVVIGALHLLPLARARRVGEWLGALGYSPLGIRKRVVERQIAAAFPALSDGEVQRLARRAYAHLGRVSIELALMGKLGPRDVLDLFEEEGDFAALEQAVAQGKGVIGFTGHVGSWELTAAYIAARGIAIDVVARHMSNPLFDAYLNQSRTNAGMQVVYDDEAVRRIPRAIREGKVVGLVADQGVLGLASTYVPFFGRPAKTPKGPAVFALRYKLPILFMAAILQPSGKYRFRVEEIPLVDTGDREADVETTVAAFTNALERLVRQHPEQYFWHHRRWKRQPADTPEELRDPGVEE
jgi:KDO2-lipid IV(A) lauroyltransferase